MHNDTSLYSVGCEEKIAADEAVFWNTVAAIPHLWTCGATSMGNLIKIPQNWERV